MRMRHGAQAGVVRCAAAGLLAGADIHDPFSPAMPAGDVCKENDQGWVREEAQSIATPSPWGAQGRRAAKMLAKIASASIMLS